MTSSGERSAQKKELGIASPEGPVEAGGEGRQDGERFAVVAGT